MINNKSANDKQRIYNLLKKTLQRCKLDNYEVMNMTIMLLSVCDSGLE